MNEQTKARNRRTQDSRFRDRFFVGEGIDVGSGDDPLLPSILYPNIAGVRAWDLPQGDAQYMTGVEDSTYDFLHSSHCLEHTRDPIVALKNWIRITKPGGFLVVTVPDELLYESGAWPSRYNPDHKHSFTLRAEPVIPRSMNLAWALWRLPVEIELLQLVTCAWDPEKIGEDQTLGPAECSIEFVARVVKKS